MKLLRVGFALCLMLSFQALSLTLSAQSTADRAAIQSLIAAGQAAWNAHDAVAFSQKFASDGSFTNIIGETTYGHAPFEEDHKQIFATIYKASSLQWEITRIKFLRPDVAVVDVDSHLSGFTRLPPGIKAEPDGRFHCKIQMVLTKDKAEWWIAAFHNVGVLPLPPRQ